MSSTIDLSDPPRSPRARRATVSARGHKRVALRVLRNDPGPTPGRPASTAECASAGLGTAENPCVFVSCPHHLYLDVNPRTGSVTLNFPGLDPTDLVDTCSLRVAERGGVELEAIGQRMNLTRERVRQLEARGLAKLKALQEAAALRDEVES